MPQCTAAAERLVCCKRPSCRRNGCAAFSACGTRRYSIAHAVISVRGTNALLLSVAKHLPASGHDLPALYSFSVRYALQTTQLPPKQTHRHFWAQCVSIQYPPRCKSASAATAPRQLSVTQHLPASDGDAAVQSSCWVSPMLHAPNLPPKQVHHDFKAQCAPIQHRSRRPRHTSTHAALCDIAVACIRAR